MGPNQDFRIKGYQSQVSGIRFPTPVGFVQLANTTMETWLQALQLGCECLTHSSDYG